jgi:hypothetical protein
MIALAILVVSLIVLIDAQATAVFMTVEAERILVATALAQEKMAEVQMEVELMGFGEQDIEEEGDFEDYEFEDLDLDFGEDFIEYKWAWTVRKIELDMIADIAGMGEDLAGSGYFGEQGEEADFGGAPDLGDMGVQPDMITDMLGDYIREVRVIVWWGEESPDDEDMLDKIELTSHVINPTGMITPDEATEQ